MSYSGDLTISIENSSVPFVLPLDNYLHEIEFTNSCDNTPKCAEEEDFKCIYDAVEERGNPNRKFKLKNQRNLNLSERELAYLSAKTVSIKEIFKSAF